MEAIRSLFSLTTVCVLIVCLLRASEAPAGAYIYAQDGRVNVVTHPLTYNGEGGEITLSVGLSSAIPDNTANQLVQPIKNAIVRWNALQATTGNLVSGANTPMAFNEIDYESVVVHELGHCIGLAHPNLADESGLSDPERNFTKSTKGADNAYNVSAAARGADDVRGSHDDVRGDDINLHWFNTTNNPFVIETPHDSTTYSRDVNDLPAGDTFPTNGDRTVSSLARYNVPNTEAVMQQGQSYVEEQHTLTADDVSTLKFAMSGLDERAGTGDDYTLKLNYVGVDDNANIVIKHEGNSFAYCSTGGQSFGASSHWRITSAVVVMGPSYNWYFNQNAVAASEPAMISPNSGATLSGASESFSWATNGTSVIDYVVYAGSSSGAYDYFNSGSLGTNTSVTITGLPTDGSTVHVTLWWYDNGWYNAKYTYTAAAAASAPAVTSPSNGATLSGASESFSWATNGTSVIDYVVYAGSSSGAYDYFNSGSLGTNTSVTITGLPTDGSTVHVTLWWYDNGWYNAKYTYTAAAAASAPAVTSPSNGATLSGASESFSWATNGTSVIDYVVYAGSSSGAYDYFNSGSLGTNTSVTITGLPTDGSTVHVTLWWYDNGWYNAKYTYTAAAAASAPAVTSPSNGATLSGASESFSWATNGTSVIDYVVYAGSSSGAYDYFNSGSLGTNTSVTITGLPTDGSTVHVTLWWYDNGWYNAKYTYTAAAAASAPAVTSPSNGATLSGASESFSWATNGTSVIDYVVYAGSSSGAYDYFNSGSLGTNTSVTITGLPTDGSTVHVTLWWYDSGWYNAKYTYTAAAAASAPAVTSPSNGATLSGASESFSWATNGTSVIDYVVYAGSSSGAYDYFNSGSLGTNTSVTITGLPTDGSTVHVTLWWYDNGWYNAKTTYNAASQAAVPNAPALQSVTANNQSLQIAFAHADLNTAGVEFSVSCVDQGARFDGVGGQSPVMTPPLPEPFVDAPFFVNGVNYDSASTWHQSDAFFEGGHRCGTEQAKIKRQDFWEESVARTRTDCDLSSTSIKTEYNSVTGRTVIVPIHFHVIYKADGTGYISEQRLADQMAALNDDFGGVTFAGNTSRATTIQFEMVGFDYVQNDAWFTDSEADENAYKTALKIDGVMNVYTNDASGYLGYAYFPSSAANSAIDGVVMLHSAVGGRNNGNGVYDQGRTLAHEIGHYLGLHHTFNGGTCDNTYTTADLLVDTPPQENADYGNTPSTVCGVDSAIENFMNYSVDTAMYTFSAEQTNRMICGLVNYRSDTHSSSASGTVTSFGPDSPLTVHGLTNGNSYSCSVAATNSSGSSSASNSTSASPYSAPKITSPLRGPALGGSQQTFNWIANGTDVTSYALYVGSTSGGLDYFDYTGTDTSAAVSGLPTDGSTVWVTLWYYKTGDGWYNSGSLAYTASN